MDALDFRPMLAAHVSDTEDIRFPSVASPKLDGVRCRVIDGKPISRSGKVLPNQFLQSWAAKFAKSLEGLDGELIIGLPYGPNVYRRTLSGISSHTGKPDFTYWVFDLLQADEQTEFVTRNTNAMQRVEKLQRLSRTGRTFWLGQTWINSQRELVNYESDCIRKGFEGVMLRDPEGAYKHGRSTLGEQGLVALKRYMDSEAIIVGIEEQLRNDNVPYTNELGYTKRRTLQAHKIPKGVMGKIRCRTLHTLKVDNEYLPPGTEFRIGTGFSERERQEMWNNQEDFLGKVIRFRYLPFGSFQKPRSTSFLGMRLEEDQD